MSEQSSSEIQEEIDRVEKERARLVTDKPIGWPDKYAELQVEVARLARR